MAILDSFSSLTLCLLGVIALLSIWFAGPGYSKASAQQSPTILTSMGIFGTFLGVAVGLLHFDTADIQASVPSLIEGLRTAFWTSIAGLFGALAVKFRHLVVSIRQQSSQSKDVKSTATITDLALLLGDIRNSLGNSDANVLLSAVVALGRGQQCQQDSINALTQSMTVYQEQMIDANTRALVGALEQVMQDFNGHINTQYGDNFKQLNDAVGSMLLWQQTYKEELQELLHSQKSNGTLLEKASSAYERMVGHTEVFQQVSDSLGGMLSALQGQSLGLDQYLSQLAQVATKATEGLPSLEGRIDTLTSDLARSVSENQRLVSEALLASVNEMKSTSAEINSGLSASLLLSQENLQQRFEQMLNSTEQQIMRLDDAMEDELTKALKTFGYQLSSLSEKFVQDYSPLTDRLHDLVALAERGRTHKAEPSSTRSRQLMSEEV